LFFWEYKNKKIPTNWYYKLLPKLKAKDKILTKT